MAYGRVSQLCNDAEDVAGAVAWGTRALDLADAVGETQIAIHALNTIGTARFMGGSPEGKEQLERSLALAKNAGLDEHVGRAMIHLVGVAQRQRRYALAYDYLEPALQYASERGLELWRGYLLGYRAQMELDLGRWPEAVDTAALVLREPRRSRIPQIVALTVVGRVRARRGDPDVWSPLDEALSLAERGEELQATGPVAVARAEAAWLDGDRDGVDRATAAALALARLRRSRSAGGRACGVAESRRDHRSARKQRDGGPSRARDRRRLVTSCRAVAGAGLAVRGGARARERGRRDQLAPGARRASGSRRPARSSDRRTAAARAGGARPAARTAPANAREPGRPHRRASSKCSPSLADGLRNAEIAQRLVVSPKTVDHHVSAILRKLDVRTRGEAVAEATRMGLTTAP